MKADYDCIVIGGGIAGLLTALRLAQQGKTVAVLERSKLGAGATTSNQGIVHSGALFAVLHPEITSLCFAARKEFQRAFPEAMAPVKSSWYIGSEKRVSEFRLAWQKLGICYTPVPKEQLATIVQSERNPQLVGTEIQDSVISSRVMVMALAARCLNTGVDLLIDTPVQNIVFTEEDIIRVHAGSDYTSAVNVVIACGVGALRLLQRLESKLVARVRSRIDMMIALPRMALDRAILCIDYGGPTIAPTLNDVVLASRYGARQPLISHSGRWPVPVPAATALLDTMTDYFTSGLFDTAGAHAWMCSKTEISAGKSDQWGVEPMYAVVDHAKLEGKGGLWTIVPGKMTLALHASRKLVAAICRVDPGLAVPQFPHPDDRIVDGLIENSPWVAPEL